MPTAAVEVLAGDGSPNAPIAAGHRSRLRWGIAAVVTAVVIAGGALGFAVLASGRSASVVLPWAPADAVVYMEIRADLPGDQRSNLLAFLSKFPGFADQTSFDTKADDGLNRLVKRLTNDRHDFSTQIKPWFGGQIGLAVSVTDPKSPGVLAIVSVRDVTAAGSWLKALEPANSKHETYHGVDIVEPTETGAPAQTSAYALDGSVILAGTLDSVKAAITRGPSGDLTGSAGFKTAQGALGGDELGSVFVDVKSYYKLMTNMGSFMSGLGNGTDASPLPMPTMNAALLPGWVAMRLRAESDHFVLDSVLPTVTVPGQPAQQSHQAVIPASLPADTVVEYEIHDVGSLIKTTLTQLEAQPGGPTAEQVDSVAKYLGGVDKAAGWIGDAGVVVLHDRAGFSGGLVAQTKDATASGNLLVELKNLANLSAGQTGVTVRTDTYAGQTITIIAADLGSGTVPTGLNLGGTPGQIEVAFTQTKDLVIVGVGEPFVKAVLDTKAGSSLADQPAYQSSINMAGLNNLGQAFVDLTALRTALETIAAGQSGMAAYDSDIKPYLVPIESIALSGSVGSDVSTERIVLVLK